MLAAAGAGLGLGGWTLHLRRQRFLALAAQHGAEQLFAQAAWKMAAAAPAQVSVPVHQHIAVVGTGSGNVPIRAQLLRRSYLGLINDSANVVYCRVDGSDTSFLAAAANEGLRLAAAGTTGDRVFFDRNVPQGPVRCYSATDNNRVLITEGR